MFRLETPGGGGYGRRKNDGLIQGRLVEGKNPQKFAKGSLYSYEQIQSSA